MSKEGMVCQEAIEEVAVVVGQLGHAQRSSTMTASAVMVPRRLRSGTHLWDPLLGWLGEAEAAKAVHYGDIPADQSRHQAIRFVTFQQLQVRAQALRFLVASRSRVPSTGSPDGTLPRPARCRPRPLPGLGEDRRQPAPAGHPHHRLRRRRLRLPARPARAARHGLELVVTDETSAPSTAGSASPPWRTHP